MSSPNVARITSLSSWTQFFHPQTGLFRLPSTMGASIKHLDIDLRFIDHESHAGLTAAQVHEVFLPNVCKLTLRGGEMAQDGEDSMDCLGEVFHAISPVEVQWLNAYDEVNEQQTMSTVMVHPTVMVAGQIWKARGTLRKLVIQGGFPVPNLTAPTPFVLTPAASPCPSPGAGPRLGLLGHGHGHTQPFGSFPGFGNTGLPNLSMTKPKPADENKHKEREERKRMADYALKPRFEWAFGSWGVESLMWRFDGRYSSAAIKTVLLNLIRALDSTFPSTSPKAPIDPPSLIAFSHVPEQILADVIDEMPYNVATYFADVAFVATNQQPATAASIANDSASDADGRERAATPIVVADAYIRAFDTPSSDKDKDMQEDRNRQSRRLKSEMLLLHSQSKIVTPNESAADSPEDAITSEDESEARTPPLGSSFHISTPVKEAQKGEISKAEQGMEEEMDIQAREAVGF